MLYNNLLVRMSDEFQRAIDSMVHVHNIDFGDEFELAICVTLTRFLPSRYGVCRGHVVPADGPLPNSDDIIIYDRLAYPLIRPASETMTFARKEQVPVDAVLAYIEAKHTANFLSEDRDASERKSTFEKAWTQVMEVKRLRRPGEPDMIPYRSERYTDGYRVRTAYSEPTPIFGAVIARRVTLDGRPLESVDEVRDALSGYYTGADSEKIDMAILGPHSLFLPSMKDRRNRDVLVGPYFVPKKTSISSFFATDKAFGTGLATLFEALQAARLRPIAWRDLLEEALEFPGPPS